MPTADELLKRLQGGTQQQQQQPQQQPSISGSDLLKRLQSAPAQQQPAQPAQPFPQAQAVEQTARKAYRHGMGMPDAPEGFSAAGVPSHRLRAALSFMDTDEEREALLRSRVGKEGFTRAPNGELALTPSGLEKLGMPRSERPVLIDQPGTPTWRELFLDMSDFAGSLPEIAGGVGAGMAASGLGLIPGMAVTGAGAATGRAGSEIAEHLLGVNLQQPEQVAGEVIESGAYGMLGEGMGRGVAAGVRKALRPRDVPPERLAVAEEARQVGAQPSVGQVVGQDAAPILRRFEGMAKRVLGDPLAQRNALALNREIARLRGASRVRGPAEAGEMIVEDVKGARSAMREWASSVSSNIDRMTNGRPVVPTRRLKEAAQQIMDELPRSADGKPIMASPKTVRGLQQIQQLPDELTVKQAQTITERLYEAAPNNEIMPGITGGYAKFLHKNARQMFDDVPGPLGEAIQQFRGRYAEQASKFDDAFVRRLLRNPGQVGSFEPEAIVPALFRKGQHSKLERLMPKLSDETREAMRSVAMEDVLSSITARTDDPLNTVFDGKALAQTLDKYGTPTLRAMFGKEVANDLRRLAQVTQMVAPRAGDSGGLVAAGVALSPISNFGLITKLNIMSKVMSKPGVIKYLTEGIKAGPDTQRGAAALNRFANQFVALAEQETSAQGIESPQGLQGAAR